MRNILLSVWSPAFTTLACFVPAFLGRNPSDFAGANAALDRAVAPGFSAGMPIGRAGLDLALHDLAGNRGRKNVAELWGKRSGGKLTLSWTVNIAKLDDASAEVEAGKKRGYAFRCALASRRLPRIRRRRRAVSGGRAGVERLLKVRNNDCQAEPGSRAAVPIDAMPSASVRAAGGGIANGAHPRGS